MHQETPPALLVEGNPASVVRRTSKSVAASSRLLTPEAPIFFDTPSRPSITGGGESDTSDTSRDDVAIRLKSIFLPPHLPTLAPAPADPDGYESWKTMVSVKLTPSRNAVAQDINYDQNIVEDGASLAQQRQSTPVCGVVGFMVHIIFVLMLYI